MAVTGLILVGFVVGHLVGNLQIFQEPDHINGYGQFLHSLGALLWVARRRLGPLGGRALVVSAGRTTAASAPLALWCWLALSTWPASARLALDVVWLGGAKDVGMSKGMTHPWIAYAVVAFNLYAFWIEYKVIAENTAMIREIDGKIAGKA